MKNKVIVSLLVGVGLFFLLLISGALFYFNSEISKSVPTFEQRERTKAGASKDVPKKESAQFVENKTGEQVSGQEVLPGDDEYGRFVSHDLGVSFNYPKTSVEYLCKVVNKNKGTRTSLPGRPETKIFEDSANGRIYLTKSFFSDDSVCGMIMVNNPDDLAQMNGGEDISREVALKNAKVVIVKAIGSESQLKEYLSSLYEIKCPSSFQLRKKDWNGQAGVFDVEIAFDSSSANQNLDNGCLLNFDYKILYSPQKQKALIFTTGQDCLFSEQGEKNYFCHESAIIDSFRFE